MTGRRASSADACRIAMQRNGIAVSLRTSITETVVRTLSAQPAVNPIRTIRSRPLRAALHHPTDSGVGSQLIAYTTNGTLRRGWLLRAVSRLRGIGRNDADAASADERPADRCGRPWQSVCMEGVRHEDPDGVTRSGRVADGRACRYDGRGCGAKQRCIEGLDAEQRKRVGAGDDGYVVWRLDGYTHIVRQVDADAAYAQLLDGPTMRHLLRQLSRSPLQHAHGAPLRRAVLLSAPGSARPEGDHCSACFAASSMTAATCCGRDS